MKYRFTYQKNSSCAAKQHVLPKFASCYGCNHR
jgi:hypothetical protein